MVLSESQKKLMGFFVGFFCWFGVVFFFNFFPVSWRCLCRTSDRLTEAALYSQLS